MKYIKAVPIIDIIIDIKKLYLNFNNIGRIIKKANDGMLSSIVP